MKQTIDYTDPASYQALRPLPPWVSEIRPHQADAVEQIMEMFYAGTEVVFLDAPTGSGKTLIAELVRRRLEQRAVYVCSDKQLQRQFITDFPYAAMLQGRANYPTEFGPAQITADDCTTLVPGEPCEYCDHITSCPYQVAKAVALGSDLAVLNTSYLLASANYTGAFSKEPTIIVDECDLLEDMLMNFVEFTVPQWILKRGRLTQPKRGVHKKTIAAWLAEVETTVRAMAQQTGWEPKMVRRLRSFASETARVAKYLAADIEHHGDSDESGQWIRVYEGGRRDDEPPFTLKPVLVRPYGTRFLWRHSARWLLMSATVISTDEMVETLGLPWSFDWVKVPMTFPVENRPIIIAPVASMTYKAEDSDHQAMARAIIRACERHPDDRILVHCVSRKLVETLIRHVGEQGGLGRRKIIEYRSARERDAALARYKATDRAVMFGQSMNRGVDLPGDLCRVQIIAKVPFPSLGDRRTSARVHLPGGDDWYAVQTIREIVQMTGRAIRSDEDHAVTYIFDAQFGRNLFKPRRRRMFPEWWLEAVDRTVNIAEFLR